MSIAATITKRIEVIEPGVIFSYRDFKMSADCYMAIVNTLNWLFSKEYIERFEKGKYFKPKQGIYGEMSLQQNQVLEYILKENGNLTGYITGTTAYNRLGLSTQIANEYIIAAYEFRRPFNNGRIKARFVKAYAEITESNIFLLQLLDAIKEIRNIPGTGTNTALELIKIKVE